MNNPIHAPPQPRMFMQSIVGRKWASYSAKLVFAMVPQELRQPVSRGSRKNPPNPSLLELTTFHIKS